MSVASRLKTWPSTANPLACGFGLQAICFSVQARRAVLGSERGQMQDRLLQLRQEVEASQQAKAALQSRNLTGEALLSKVCHFGTWRLF